ncbi:hydantoinase B/oxoprolinase [Dictyocaulus viviparus]|uniref:Hydantoinase B/oxoprolinase n=1 Tax=Dictyocaulus viviparus TaxID=29172 RepID=A0A0D8Y9D3_DICVI|nr:hydantoinase B/oxoprolinase [Dictyocaulus viviparus]
MQYAVRYQIDSLGLESINEGDVILSNHPRAGGSHLPDLTVITPVFFKNIAGPVFFLANRGHHADIGGIAPGSMPPHANFLEEEGATFVSFKVVNKGSFQEDLLLEYMNQPGSVPGRLQGISLVCDLINEYGFDVVQAYMRHIQSTAEESVREMLKEVGSNIYQRSGSTRLQACDSMDDGTEIQLSITIDVEKQFILTLSHVVKISIPDGTLLSPSELAAVVGGNVLTSQRICDVILKAFEAVAASQGCMNNLTFGDDSMGYYETIAGGAGAGDGFNGRSAIHTHMTNTRITDPEILESRYPVILREFSVRENSGGKGKWRGGDGVIRSLQFRRPLCLSLLTERRVFAPYGLNGGQNGARGLNILKRQSRVANLGGKISINIETADILTVMTPGGGGYGAY